MAYKYIVKGVREGGKNRKILFQKELTPLTGVIVIWLIKVTFV